MALRGPLLAQSDAFDPWSAVGVKAVERRHSKLTFGLMTSNLFSLGSPASGG
jgi:hypothetical protein